MRRLYLAAARMTRSPQKNLAAPGRAARLTRGLLWALCLGFVAFTAPPAAEATPFYSMAAARECDTCHAEPLGWFNPDNRWDRRCTLDCQGCHVSPTGGGLRTPLGRYYAREELGMWGRRPSASANMEIYRPDGAPDQGRFSLQDGFSGWWPGEVQHRTIPDRLGDINPAPVAQGGVEFRHMTIVPVDGDATRDVVSFPMQLDAYVAVHPLSNLTAYLDVGYHGSTTRSSSPPEGAQADDFIDIFWLREVWAMLHDLPGSSYVRAGRMPLPYGWRIPDHTAFIRDERFDQDRHAYGVEVGLSPNIFWGNLMAWYQGIDSWPGEITQPRAGGVTAQGGMRGLGYQLGASLHASVGEDGFSETMFGPMWAVNLAPVVYIGELDYQRLDLGSATPSRDQLFALHEVQWLATEGFTPKARYEWLDPDLRGRDDHQHRLLAGFEWNPLWFLQFDVSWRQAFLPSDGRDASEILIQLHAHY